MGNRGLVVTVDSTVFLIKDYFKAFETEVTFEKLFSKQLSWWNLYVNNNCIALFD